MANTHEQTPTGEVKLGMTNLEALEYARTRIVEILDLLKEVADDKDYDARVIKEREDNLSYDELEEARSLGTTPGDYAAFIASTKKNLDTELKAIVDSLEPYIVE